MILNYIITYVNNREITEIRIHVDNLPILQFISGKNFPKYNSTKLMIENIFIKLNQIQQRLPETIIQFYKVEAHANNPHNETVDKLAKEASINTKYNQNKFSEISYNTTMTQIYKQTHYEWKQKWKNRNTQATQFSYQMFKNNPELHKKIYKLIKLMNKDESAIIHRFISGHIELNHFMYTLYKDAPTIQTDTPLCTQCNQKKNESITHYLLKCPKYTQQRYRMINELRKHWQGFNDQTNINLKNLLHPYKIKRPPDLEKEISIKAQLKIWKSVLHYIKETKRFTDLYYVNLEKLP